MTDRKEKWQQGECKTLSFGRVLLYMAETFSRSVCHGYAKSRMIGHYGPMNVTEPASAAVRPALPFRTWNSWLGDTPADYLCPLNVPAGTKLGARATARELCRYYGAARKSGQPSGLSTQLAREAFQAILEVP